MPDSAPPPALGGSLLRERLAPAIARAGTQTAFAALAGLPKDSLAKYLAGSQPGPAALIKLADAAGVTIDYLVGRTAASGPEDAVSGGFVAVPHLAVRASAGSGRAVVPFDSDAEQTMMIRESWLRSMGGAPQTAEFVVAEGDSMDPTIKNGDLMLVDRGFGDVLDGKIYVFVRDGLVSVKRVQRLALGGLMLISDNERYPTQTIAAREMDELNIEARVAWYGRAM